MAKIGINATLLTPKSGGIGEYMIQLIRHILQMDKQNEYVIFISLKYKDYLQKHLPNARLYPIDLPVENQIKRTLLEPFVWPSILKQAQIDLFHSPVSYIPLGVNIPAIVTVHDLRYWYFPKTYPKLRGLYLSRMIPRSIRRAKHVIAISNFTRENIIEQFSTSPEKISVIHQGLDLHKYQKINKELQTRCKTKYNLPEHYILSLGHLEPRKNYQRLAQAFSQVVNNGLPHDLVIVGKEYYEYEQIYAKVNSLGLQNRIHFTGFVDEEYLAPLYQMADLFVAPSIFEGFGFTPVEAMAANTPVVAAAASSFPEVLGDAALYFDPYNEQEIADRMLQVLHNPETVQPLLRKGQEQIQKYHWQRCAEHTLSLYAKLLQTNL